jgi:murein DD-endopeptidase
MDSVTASMGRVTRRAALRATAGALASGVAFLAMSSTPAEARASDAPSALPIRQGSRPPVLVEITVFQNPSPFAAAGRTHLLYELHLTNFQRMPLTLSAIETGGLSGPTMPTTRVEGAKLADMIVPVGASAPPEDPLTLLPGARNIAFMALSFESAAQVPSAFSHTLVFRPAQAGQPEGESVLPTMEIAQIEPLVIGTPAYGERWIAANAASNTSIHRRTPLVVHGRTYFAQRYAIDLVQIGDDGRGYSGDRLLNESWYCYGKELLAVADGVVVDTHDGIPDNVPLKSPVIPITFETVAGNYLVVDLGNGRAADYAHLIPGSLRVTPGDRVRRGDVLGLLGNSGNSTAPHLHFHVTDRPSFLEANGIPYHFERVRIQKARVLPGEDDFQAEIVDPAVREATRELVLEDDLIGFDGP